MNLRSGGLCTETMHYQNDCVKLLFLRLDPFSTLPAMKDHNATSMSGVTHDFGDLSKLVHSMCLSAFRYCSIHGERTGCHFRKFHEMHTYGDELMGESISSLCFFRSRNAAGPSGRPRVYTTCLLCVGICITGCYRIPKMSALSTAW